MMISESIGAWARGHSMEDTLAIMMSGEVIHFAQEEVCSTDWLFIDTIWVALSDWRLIPGTEDLNDTWHSVHVKQWKMLWLIPFSVPLTVLMGGLYWLIGKMM